MQHLLNTAGSLTADLHRRGVPCVSHSPPLYRGWRGISMEEWRAIVVLRRPELLELEGLLPVVSKDWDVEIMGNERGGAAGLQHLPCLSLPRVRSFWGLDVFPKVTRTTGSVRERYVPLWWKPPPQQYEYADRLPAGASLPACFLSCVAIGSRDARKGAYGVACLSNSIARDLQGVDPALAAQSMCG